MSMFGAPPTINSQRFLAAAHDLAKQYGLAAEVLHELAHVALCHEYPKNNILFYQGDPAESVFIVLRGCVRISHTKDDGREIVLAIIPAGGVVGLVAAQDQGVQPGTAVTVDQCQLAKIDADSFTSWVKRHEQVERLLLTLVSGRLRDAYEKIAEQALLGARDRLLHELVAIAERDGKPDAAGDTWVFTRPTQQELAARIGSCREVVSRLLRELDATTDVSVQGRTIRVSRTAITGPPG